MALLRMRKRRTMMQYVYRLDTSIDFVACPVISLQAHRQHPALNLLDDAHPKRMAHRTISMVARTSKSIINKDAQAIGQCACCVRPQRADPSWGDARRVARSRIPARGIASNGSACLDHASVDRRNTDRLGTHLRPSREPGRGHRNHPNIQQAGRYAQRYATHMKGRA